MDRNWDADVEKIIDRFDWQSTKTVMKALNWTWYSNNISPNEGEMKYMARQLMQMAIDSHEKSGSDADASSGGLVARISVYPGGSQLSLAFEAVSCREFFPEI